MTVSMIVCKECGVVEKRRGSRHIYCLPCARKIKKIRKGLSGLEYPRKGKCRMCKTDIIRRNGFNIYCAECSKKREKEKNYEKKSKVRETLSDWYIIDSLKKFNRYIPIPSEEFPKELIILARVHASITRNIRSK